MSKKPKNRLYCRVGEQSAKANCPAFRINPRQPLTDDTYRGLQEFVKQQLDRAASESGRKRHAGSGTASVSVGFYLCSTGTEPLAQTVQCWKDTFDAGGLQQDNLRLQLKFALEKAREKLGVNV